MHAYIHVKGTISVPNTAGAVVAVNNTNEKLIFNNCAPFTNCMSEINNTQVDDAQDIDVVMPMYNLIKYCDAYSKTGSLWQYYIDESALHSNNSVIDFTANNKNSISFNFKH